MAEELLIKTLTEKKVSEGLIDFIINNGYIVRRWQDFQTPEGYLSISDKMYGNKQFSSSFEIDSFIKYAKGENEFKKLNPFITYTVKTVEEINEIFNDKRRRRYIDNGQMSFRGQIKEHTFKRELPNPRRSLHDDLEISIIPGALRSAPLGINPNKFKYESYSFQYFLKELEPNNAGVFFDSSHAYDLMRVEQHYARQTNGLDISFGLNTALFFATNKFNWNDDRTAFYSKIAKGEHQGVIYSFVFRDPPVKKTQYLIRNFDLFKTYTPERILRQNCGLPLFNEYDRNIAVCDIDCIIYLDSDFQIESIPELAQSYLFPNEKEDKFYSKLIELKRTYNESKLENIVEYGIKKAHNN